MKRKIHKDEEPLPFHSPRGKLLFAPFGLRSTFDESWTETAVIVHGDDSQTRVVIFQMVCPCERDVIFLVNRDLHVEGLGKSSLRHVLVRKISDFTVWKKYVRVNLVKQGVMIIMVFERFRTHSISCRLFLEFSRFEVTLKGGKA